MHKKYAAICLAVYLLIPSPESIDAQDAGTVLSTVVKAMGIENLRTIEFSGTGSNAGIGQNVNPNVAWPVTRVKAYTRRMDLDAMESHVEFVRVQGGRDQTQNQYASKDSPWSSQFSYWLTPFGFIRGALSNNATLSSATMDGMQYSVVTFTLQNKYKVVGYINSQNLIERVRTWIDNDVLGDMTAEAWYSVYKDFSGVKFPTMIVEKQAGFPVLILAVSVVNPNAAVDIVAPAVQAAGGTGVQQASVQSVKVADGVFHIKGGTHHSVVIEFADHAVVIEAPLNEQRSLAVIGEVKKLMSNKPIRYVVNTHHHFDQAGGLRTYVEEGATIMTHAINADFFAEALAAPRTLNPDRLSQSGKKADIEAVSEQKVLEDSARKLELHLIKDNPHHDGILMAFLPNEKILIEADVYTPPNPNAPAAATPPVANRATVNAVDNVERLKLDFETILPLHGTVTAARADLYTAIGKPVRRMEDILNPAAEQAGNAAAARQLSVEEQLLDKACTGCHNLNRVTTRKLNAADWRATVVRMQVRGAEISDNEIDTLVDYLAKNYGPQ